MSWYVQVQNQNYGPYTDDQMQAFVGEGRVVGQSLISNDPNRGFFHAEQYENFGLWSGTQRVAAAGGGGAAYAYTPSPAQTQSTPHPAVTAPTPSIQPTDHARQASSVFLIMAEITSEGSMGFLQALQGFGTAERISNTVWLLRSAASVEQLRNSLSQSLTRQDRLFILDSRANKTAWFNIGADLDHRIRDLWQDEDT